MNRNLYILAFLLSSFTNILAETPVFQPKSIKEIDFEKSSKLFDSAIKKLSDYKDKVVFTKEEALAMLSARWDAPGEAAETEENK